ncbi:MAG TPA: helix-turn-helix transcriptional regulator [Acidimicrobiales bacterium]|nr:helix-turn-helix transcriptional regulator [Acidimicrobiales bacterium]
MAKRRSELTTTSYAMLGMLAIRPWTTYELAKHMDRSLGRLWPRARSNLFNEPKRLVTHGLAQATAEPVGRRPRTLYTITPEGRRALRAWLAAPGAGPVLEFEQMLKVFFADQGSTADTRAAVRRVRAWADEQRAENVAVARSYLAGTGPFPERAAVLALVGRFMSDFADLVGAWADWATTVIDDWPDDPREAAPAWHVLDEIAGGRPRGADRADR